MRWYVGGDHGAVELRRVLVEHLRARGDELLGDTGPQASTDSVDYPDIAVSVCRQVLADPGSFGLLVCGTGQGVAIAANRLPGIRAALVSDAFSARQSREHNDANVICMGGRVIGPGLAVDLLEAFARASFEGGRHQRRVDKIEAIQTSAGPSAGPSADAGGSAASADGPPRTQGRS
jgi:ribose 5-phosphate isomerase B